ncbi:unnamed protein product [Heligmosomoides polygyrus]|uniref:Col_cuticle_N domain-containing protein n=1 Tax=Heligmosomoides polygyrus TaxID=6339 RepID=A0A183GJM2_HELPZ|nr:unnamed protein product [Heligmosomoides polygyrus]
MTTDDVIRRIGIAVCVLSVITTSTLLLTVASIWQRASYFKSDAMSRGHVFGTKSQVIWAEMNEMSRTLRIPRDYDGTPAAEEAKHGVLHKCSQCTRLHCPAGQAGKEGPSGQDGEPGGPGKPGSPGIDGEDMELDAQLAHPALEEHRENADSAESRAREDITVKTFCFCDKFSLYGVLGDAGNPGTPGSFGTTGFMGRGGASGNPGIRGAPGDNAICECFLNTHKEVSSKLALSAGEGIKGPRGPSGTQGAKGQPGTAGRPSNFGSYGERGQAGPPGEPGMPSAYCPSDCGVNTILSEVKAMFEVSSHFVRKNPSRSFFEFLRTEPYRAVQLRILLTQPSISRALKHHFFRRYP